MKNIERLSFETLKNQNYEGFLLREAPERILQFGEGNFLRAFADYFVDLANERCDFRSKIVVVLPTGRSNRVRDILNSQDGLYTLLLRGRADGKRVDESRVISSISRCLNPVDDYEAYMTCAANPDLRFIISNTTEAGIRFDASCRLEDRPAASYPGKLTQLLYARFRAFGGKKGSGLIILPCELIDDNAGVLKKCVLQYVRQWNLGGGFLQWLEEENQFCPTLVDRIVTGYPKAEAEAIQEKLGYQDGALDVGEAFALWVIEAEQELNQELPFAKAGLPVLVTDNHRPYKQRKVRILNGAHTSMVPGAFLAGKDIVRDCMQDETIRSFMEQTVFEEIIPTLTLPKEELTAFAAAVTDRFNNPFIDHSLLDISLNCTSKWKARVLPSLKGYVEKYGKLPECLTASLAFYLEFYHGVRLDESGFTGVRPSVSPCESTQHDRTNDKTDSALRDKTNSVCPASAPAEKKTSGEADSTQGDDTNSKTGRTQHGDKCESAQENCREPKPQEYPIRDDRSVLEFFCAHRLDDAASMAEAALSQTGFWGENLTEIPGLSRKVAEDLQIIRTQGARTLMQLCAKPHVFAPQE